jgi:hypothetical protein
MFALFREERWEREEGVGDGERETGSSRGAEGRGGEGTGAPGTRAAKLRPPGRRFRLWDIVRDRCSFAVSY